MSAPCAGCRKCGCGPTDDPDIDYDFTCEVCGCGPSMDPAPAAALVAAEKAQLDAALGAPAVPVGVPAECCTYHATRGTSGALIDCQPEPVGVQPEPAEERRHHPKCFQSTDTAESLVAEGLPPDICDCRTWRLFDATGEKP